MAVQKGFFRAKIIFGILSVCLFLNSGCGRRQAEAPGEDIVATYSGENLTQADLKAYISRKGAKEEEHAICEIHGFDHSQCNKLEPCEIHPIHSLRAYQIMIRSLVSEQMIENWAKEKGITGRKEVKHGLKHLVEEINLGSLAAKMHEDELAPDEIEMKQYYEEHNEEYQGRSFSEVEREIRNKLAVQKEEKFIPEYIEKLTENAVVSKNYDLLKVEEPTEEELREYYESHTDEYIEPEKVKISQIKINSCSTCSTKAKEDARKKAEEALVKLMAGEDFQLVAEEYSDGIFADSGGDVPGYIRKGDKSKVFEMNIFNLGINEISDVFEDEGNFYTVKIFEKQTERQKFLEEVINKVKAGVIQEKEDKNYELNKFEALFNVHGKRFTLGEFKEEFSELTLEDQRQLASFEAKKLLVDRLIIRELLLEDVGDKMLDRENKEMIADIKTEIISQILHAEEVDEKIEISDEEAKKFYDERKHLFTEPAKAKISYIRISQGSSGDEEKRARKKIEEAYQKIKSGTDFAQAAKEYSEDWTSRSGGESNQWIYEGASYFGEMIEHGFHKVVFKLKPEEVSKVFDFMGHFFIVKMRQKEKKRQQTFEEANPHIKEGLSVYKHQERTLELQDELLKKANLVIYDSVLKQMLREEKEKQKEVEKEARRK